MPTFEDVRKSELKMKQSAVETAVAAAAISEEAPGRSVDAAREAGKRELVGMAFSGGGIRSATFNLGILQGLAKANLLDKIDYLSTVSGGGYIGGWLARWVKGAGMASVQKELGHFVPHEEDGVLLAEPREVSFLRDYSNYLTPRKGIFGADTWSAIAAYLRNVLLNQAILISFLGGLLFLPWLLGRARGLLATNNPQADAVRLAMAAYALLIFTICSASDLAAGSSISDPKPPARAKQERVMALVALPLFFSAILLSGALWVNNGFFSWWAWGVAGGIVLGVAHAFGMAARWLYLKGGNPRRGALTRDQVIFIPVFGFAAGFVGGLLLQQEQRLFFYWKTSTAGAGIWHAASWGPPLMVVLFLMAGALHIGLLKLLITVQEQEWWARLGGLLALLSLGWAATFALTIFVPLAIVATSGWIAAKAGLFAAWAGSTIWGLLAGRGAGISGKPEDRTIQNRAAVIAPYIFVAGLIVLLSLGGHWLTAHLPTIGTAAAPAMAGGGRAADYWIQAGKLDVLSLLAGLAALLALSAGLALRVDINVFSMNLLYRNRLVRCYLGAARKKGERHPNPFTGFDPADDESLALFSRSKGYDGPYPIYCAALNITHGEKLAWQERRAESFVFTPEYCGYEYRGMQADDENRKAGFHRTNEYAYRQSAQSPMHKDCGGLHLGTAISISGAAASPNMGFHTSPPLAFLMTVFNVRLGWWLANPRYENSKYWRGGPEGGPRCSLLYLLNELLANTTDRSKYVYLSDGGHFENLGIYELVRRRCPYIIACDADADRAMVFGDLGNAIRKCRSDFGVEIEINTDAVKLPGPGSFARAHGVLGRIRYPGKSAEEPAFEGQLLYIKATMTKGAPRDVLAYRDAHQEFPDDTTLDQWFDEAQFESYRKLGLHSFESLTGAEAGAQAGGTALTIADLFQAIAANAGQTG